MTLSLGIIDAMVESGCTAVQLAAAIRADVNDRVERRLYRAVQRALFVDEILAQGEPPMASSEMTIPDTTARHVHEGPTEGTSIARLVHHNPDVSLKAVARHAVGVMSGLSSTAVRVMTVLIDCCNLTTGRCDPSMGKIAERLGLEERAVRRAIARLCSGPAPILVSLRHGGRFRANAFAIQWARLREIAQADGWLGAPNMNMPDTSASRAVPVHMPGKTVRQNLLKNPDSDSESAGVERARARPKGRSPDPAQREFLLPIQGGQAASEAAHEAAAARLWREAHAHVLEAVGKDGYVTFMTAIPQALWDSAAQEDLRRRGSGLPFLLARMGEPVARAPPEAKSG